MIDLPKNSEVIAELNGVVSNKGYVLRDDAVGRKNSSAITTYWAKYAVITEKVVHPAPFLPGVGKNTVGIEDSVDILSE